MRIVLQKQQAYSVSFWGTHVAEFPNSNRTDRFLSSDKKPDSAGKTVCCK
jgi:hypothetical protein